MHTGVFDTFIFRSRVLKSRLRAVCTCTRRLADRVHAERSAISVGNQIPQHLGIIFYRSYR